LTGKFDEDRHADLLPGERPHRVIGSLADLPALLGL
jgi:hypothetical protein